MMSTKPRRAGLSVAVYGRVCLQQRRCSCMRGLHVTNTPFFPVPRSWIPTTKKKNTRTTPAASSSGQMHRVFSATGGMQYQHASGKKVAPIRDLTSLQLLTGPGWLARLAEVRSRGTVVLVEGRPHGPLA